VTIENPGAGTALAPRAPPAEAGDRRGESAQARSGAEQPVGAVLELLEAAAQFPHFGVLADQQVPQSQDLLAAACQLLAQRGDL
jgi:hypothetical protein